MRNRNYQILLCLSATLTLMSCAGIQRKYVSKKTPTQEIRSFTAETKQIATVTKEEDEFLPHVNHK